MSRTDDVARLRAMAVFATTLGEPREFLLRIAADYVEPRFRLCRDCGARRDHQCRRHALTSSHSEARDWFPVIDDIETYGCCDGIPKGEE